MILGKFSYLFYTLIFTLIPIIILWTKKFHFLKKNFKVIGMTVVVFVIYTLIASYFAQLWGTWFYSHDKILGIFVFNFPFEDLIFSILVSFVISSAALVLLFYKEKGRFKFIGNL